MAQADAEPATVPNLAIDPAMSRSSSLSRGSTSPSVVAATFAKQARSVTEMIQGEALRERDLKLRTRLAPYMRSHKQAEETIRQARATSVATVSIDFARKQREAAKRLAAGASSVRGSTSTAKARARPSSAPTRRKQQHGATKQQQHHHQHHQQGSSSGAAPQATTVLASAVPAASAAAGAASAGAATIGGGGGGGGGGFAGGGAGETSEQKNLDQLRRLLRSTNAYTGQPLASDLTTPEALKLPWGGNAQRYYMASTPDRNLTQRHLKKWDSTPYIAVPYECRGLRPVNVSKSEPWAKQAMQVWDHAAIDNPDAATAPPGFATAGLVKLDDGSKDDIVMLRKRRTVEDRRSSDEHQRKPWDFTPWHNVPPALRGLQIVTKEKWGRDNAAFMHYEGARRAEAAARSLMIHGGQVVVNGGYGMKGGAGGGGGYVRIKHRKAAALAAAANGTLYEEEEDGEFYHEEGGGLHQTPAPSHAEMIAVGMAAVDVSGGGGGGAGPNKQHELQQEFGGGYDPGHTGRSWSSSHSRTKKSGRVGDREPKTAAGRWHEALFGA